MRSNLLLTTVFIVLFLFKSNAQLVSSKHAYSTTKGFTGKPQYQIATKRGGVFLGNINIELFPNIAPRHVTNFDSLVSKQFYDSTAFHRVIPGFMIQGGDPNSKHGPKSTWGNGDSTQPTVNAEFSAAQHLRGILSAARDTAINSANSQFFICVAPAAWLNGLYSIYGQVVSGMNFVDTIVKSPRDANDNPLQKIEMFITYTGSNDSIPASPALVSPISATQGIPASQLLKWTAVGDAIIYHLEVSTDSMFTNLFTSLDIPTPSYTINNLAGSTKYYWRVKTNNGGHYSGYSTAWNFTTVTGAANLLLPVNTAINESINPLFKWDSVPNATSYRLQVSFNSAFSAGGLAVDQNNIPTTYYQVNGLIANTKYYWRVRSVNGTTEGMYSVKYSFKTTNNTAINNLSEDAGYKLEQNFPNPFDHETIINYTVPIKEHVSLKIYNIQGCEMATLLDEMKEKGKYQIRLDMHTFPAGVYFYHFITENYSSTKKLIIEKR